MKHFFWICSIYVFSLKSGNTFPVRNCLLKFFFFGGWGGVGCNSLSHPEPHEFSIKVTNVVYLPLNTMSLIQHLDQRAIRMFTMDGQLYGRESWWNIIKVWKDYTFGDAITVIEKNCEIHQTWDNKLLLEKTVSRCCAWLHRLYNRANQGNHVDIEGKKRGGGECEGFQDMDLREIQELIDITSQEQTEATWWRWVLPNQRWIKCRISARNKQKKLTTDSLTEEFWLLKTAFDFFETWILLWYEHWN